MPKDQNQGLPTLKQFAREKGFVRLPPLFVKVTDMPEVHQIAAKYTGEINRMRAELNRQHKEQMLNQKVKEERPEPYESEFDPLAINWPGMN